MTTTLKQAIKMLEDDDAISMDDLHIKAVLEVLYAASTKIEPTGLHPIIAASIAAWIPPPPVMTNIGKAMDAAMLADKLADGYGERSRAQAMADQIKMEKTE